MTLIFFTSQPRRGVNIYKRLWRQYKTHGVQGIISKKRGGKGNRAYPEDFKKNIVSIISRKYMNCKPGFVTEKLNDHEDIKISDEAVRQLMIKHHLWIPGQRKKQIHQRRNRRESEGEMVQMDASDHRWFENRGPKCHLHLIVDDATGKLKGGYFAKEETTEGYYKAIQPYLEREGRPVDIYCDRRGTFKVNNGKNRKMTQFQRAMKELGINMIYAMSPQAKGRIERTFGTLQNRLVCELRLRHISTMEEANKYLEEFITDYNAKYAKSPASPFNAHRDLTPNHELKYILCFKYARRVTKNLEVKYKGQIYQLDKRYEKLQRNRIEVIETLDGEFSFSHNNIKLRTKVFTDTPIEQGVSRNIERFLKSRKIIPINTPWRGKLHVQERNSIISEEERKLLKNRMDKRIQEARRESIDIMNDE